LAGLAWLGLLNVTRRDNSVNVLFCGDDDSWKGDDGERTGRQGVVSFDDDITALFVGAEQHSVCFLFGASAGPSRL
jgi:hypothetical protein